MKLEVGMYVRTPKGIAKIEEITEDRTEIYFNCDTGLSISFIKKDFTQEEMAEFYKHSYNIIELIEEKDLLEIEYFSLRYEKRVTRLFEVTFKEKRFINLDNAKCQFLLIDNDWTDNDKELEPIIKTIVTKEQFESMSYKVGD
jgi:hypothetical protein